MTVTIITIFLVPSLYVELLIFLEKVSKITYIYTTKQDTKDTYKMVTPSKQTSVTDLSTTIISVSNTSEPICNRQNNATRREPDEQQKVHYTRVPYP